MSSLNPISSRKGSPDRKFRRELRVVFLLSTIAVALSGAIYAMLLFSTSGSPIVSVQPEQDSSPALNAFGQGPPAIHWEPTGEYRVEQSNASMTIHKINIRPDSTVVLYTFDSGADEAAEPDTIELTDDLGKKYSVVKNEILGSSQGVTAGVLTTEPHAGGGTILSLTVSGVRLTAADGTAAGRLDGSWTLPFVKNNEPDREPGYFSGARIAPEIVSTGDLRMSFDSFQGGFFRLLIDRSGRETAIYSERSAGTLRSVSKDEWHRLFAEVNGFADPGSLPEWPSSAYQAGDPQP